MRRFCFSPSEALRVSGIPGTARVVRQPGGGLHVLFPGAAEGDAWLYTLAASPEVCDVVTDAAELARYNSGDRDLVVRVPADLPDDGGDDDADPRVAALRVLHMVAALIRLAPTDARARTALYYVGRACRWGLQLQRLAPRTTQAQDDNWWALFRPYLRGPA